MKYPKFISKKVDPWLWQVATNLGLLYGAVQIVDQLDINNTTAVVGTAGLAAIANKGISHVRKKQANIKPNNEKLAAIKTLVLVGAIGGFSYNVSNDISDVIEDVKLNEQTTLNKQSNTPLFPITPESLSYVLDNWGDDRNKGNRCHAGIDIFTEGKGKVRSMDCGIVLNEYPFTKCKGKLTKAVAVYHPNINGGITVIYGEINKNALQVEKGDYVEKGQYLGKATNCGMLHLEVYKGKVNQNKKWNPPKRKSSIGENKCANRFYKTKPGGLLNPKKVLRHCSPSVKYKKLR